jgi:hypothetical protein
MAMIVALFLCPALTRVMHVQPLAQAHNPTYTPSFQRSLGVPPDPLLLAPDASAVIRVWVSLDVPTDVRWVRPNDDLLPPPPAASHPRSLRAPPVGIA